MWRSQQDAAERRAEWEPKTREEAQKLWKSMQDTPDHLTLLDMYKSVGVQPIKLAKFVLPLHISLPMLIVA